MLTNLSPIKTDHSNRASSHSMVRTQFFFGKYLAWNLIYSMPLKRTVNGLPFFLWQIPEFTEWSSMAHCLYPSVRRKGRQALRESSGNPIDDTWEVDVVFYRSEATGSGGNNSKCSSIRNKILLYTFFYINTLKIMLSHVITFQKHANLKGKQKKCPSLTRCICWHMCIYFSPVKIIMLILHMYISTT